MNKNLLIAGVVAATAATLVLAAPAEATGEITSKKVGICHATGSTKNPYVFIVVSKSAAEAHKNHQDHRDIVGAKSEADCKKGEVKKDDKGEVKGSNTTPTATPTPGKGGPATLPETGAGLSMLIGLPALALAGRAYLRSR
ncbi:MAG: hypothetical protein K0S68_344 [Candidatus Saccharibacteria bacterium]|jgi:hypothetical protein|nr:hypothetical protein [Candidatus Saccharibacteria bacterium]